ncbi:hypothetical protein [Streptomyces sp. N35]|uniref:hypothetical protein n=1 Tax=Streptomyces sp. N35 TaxID=2795730 RepID=UPI0035ABB580
MLEVTVPAPKPVPPPATPASTAQHRPTLDHSAPPGECDLVTVPTRQGLEAVDILRRGAPAVGPVLHDDSHDTLGFVVPPGTADGWDLPGSACTQTAGRGLPLASPSAPDTGAGWLLPPTDGDQVTDPAALREALGEAARMIAAADGCRE